MLKIPQIHTVVFRSSHNVLAVGHRKRGCDAEYFVGMSGVYLYKLPSCIVRQLLCGFNQIKKRFF